MLYELKFDRYLNVPPWNSWGASFPDRAFCASSLTCSINQLRKSAHWHKVRTDQTSVLYSLAYSSKFRGKYITSEDIAEIDFWSAFLIIGVIKPCNTCQDEKGILTIQVIRKANTRGHLLSCNCNWYVNILTQNNFSFLSIPESCQTLRQNTLNNQKEGLSKHKERCQPNDYTP